MNGEHWRRVEDVFHRVASLPPAERSPLLARECANDEKLLRDVEALLAHDADSTDVIGGAVGRVVDRLSEDVGRSGELLGKHVGGYVITELLGEGGMGMVFKALDTRLNRCVAIKVLPPDSFADSERKRRFLQEARSASALNHPNIVTIYGIIEQEGMDFIVMEYVPGKTLDRLISRKGLALRQALKYCLDIADALSAAHGAGIVHRDIKPSNIMVTNQDHVKVLDFGLAKLTEPAGKEGERNSLETEPGKVMGTAAYMSPEQAQGKPADTRSDIFSFGTVLYELVTGRRPFQGESIMSIMAAVINTDPPPVRSVVANVPPEIERIVARCLRKDPTRRIQHMVDVRLALEEALEDIDSAPVTPLSVKPRQRLWLAFAILALMFGLLLGAFLAPRIIHRTPVTFRRLTFRQGDVDCARFAPGGSVVYCGAWDGAPTTLYAAQPGGREARDLGLPPAEVLSISQSGEMLIRLLTHDTLAQVPIAGGVPRELLEDVSAADWDPAGKGIAVVRTVAGQHRVEYPIGTVLYETSQVRPPLFLRLSPRGDLAAFFDVTALGDYAVTIVGSQHPRQILSTGWRAVGGLGWSPSGREIWFVGERTGFDPAIYAVDLSGRERLLEQIAGRPVLYDITSDGRLLLSSSDSRIGIRSRALGAREERELAWLDASSVEAMSSDGKLLLFTELGSGEGRNPAIYIRRTDGAPAVRLGYGNRPALSPDGKSVLCVRLDGTASQLLLLPVGAGEARTIPVNGIRPQSAEWFPEGKRILIIGSESNQQPRTYVADLATGAVKPITAPGVRASRVSPDGRAAVVITSTGKVSLQSIDTGAQTAIGAVDAGVSAVRWSSDGRHLFLLKRSGSDKASILRMDTSSGRTETWRELKTPDPIAFFPDPIVAFFHPVVLSSDGQAYAFSYQRDLATLYLVQGLR